MSEGHGKRFWGLAADLGFSFVTYVVLATILGSLAIILGPTLVPILGETIAAAWWIPIALGYCAWQFFKFRRLRQAKQEFPTISD